MKIALPAEPGRLEPLRLWGGIECTVNRLGASYRDQLIETGHAAREDDLAPVARLGLGAIRYPVLWERIAADHPDERDWSWHDDRLCRLHELGQHIIAGLVHHGSGPRYTNLLDPGFASGVAAHARAVAERFSFITDWTPINEPVTTARFSTLYGHWYPHHRDEKSFWFALLNQTDATREAMRAVRSINPSSRLVQTEDLGRTYATAVLRDQAGYDNARRWMSWDLLCGLVRPGHDLWSRLCDFGFRARLETIADDPCPPDIIGINHYLTSDRFLDHRHRRYPHSRDRAHERQAYVDTEAIRVLDPAPQGLAGCVQEAWNRYRLPIAITEVHNGCTREDQMRWMISAWNVAEEARSRDIPVVAVTSWALFGSSGWDTLLTGPGRYEPGTFDVTSGAVRTTAMAPLLMALTEGVAPNHPVVQGSGWWKRPIRFHHAPIARAAPLSERPSERRARHASSVPPVLIAGGNGTLGRAFAAACEHRGIASVSLGRDRLDLLDLASISCVLDLHRPWLVINAAGWVRVDDAEDRADACIAINAGGAELLAKACAARGIQSVHFSSDLVFDGRAGRAYDETDAPSPLNVYGHSKAEAERAIAELDGRHLMVRTAAFFSPFDDHNFAVHACDALSRGNRFGASERHVVTPTYVPDLCDAVLDLAIDGEQGLWHLTNGESRSWADFAREIAAATGMDGRLIEARTEEELGWRALRPLHVPLATRRGQVLPPLADAIMRFARDRRNVRDAPQAGASPSRELCPCR